MTLADNALAISGALHRETPPPTDNQDLVRRRRAKALSNSIQSGPRFIVATNTTCKQRIEVTYHELTVDIDRSTRSHHLAGIDPRWSGGTRPSGSLLHRIRGG